MIEFDTFTYNNSAKDFKITNYNSVDLTEVDEYLASIDASWFIQYKLTEGCKLEKIMLDVYGTTKYTDIVLFLNHRDAVFGMPVMYDVVDDSVLQETENYYNRVFGDQFFLERQKIQDTDDSVHLGLQKKFKELREHLRSSMAQTELEENLKRTVIRLPIPPKISVIAAKISEILNTQKEMYNLVELEHNDQ